MHGKSSKREVDPLAALHDPDLDPEVSQLLSGLWAHVPTGATDPEVVVATLRQLLGEPRGFEATRVVSARAALDRWLGRSHPSAALLAQAGAGDRTFALTFGGQASPYIDELAVLVRRSPAAAKIVRAVAERLRQLVDELPASDRAFYVHGMDPLRWLEDPASRPSTAYLMSSPVSQALILATQVGHFVALLESGFDRPEFWEHVRAASGHSQGIMAATLFSESWGKTDLSDRAADFAGYQMFQGLREQGPASLGRPDPKLVAAARAAGAGDPAPLAAVQGLSTEELERAIRALGVPVVIGLDNGRVRKVLSGRPADLEPLRRTLVDEAEARKRARARGQHAGAMPVPSWQYLPVTTPFHGPWMSSALEVFVEDLRRLGFRVRSSDLKVPVLDTESVTPMEGEDLAPRLAELQFTVPVRWGRVVDALRATGANVFLDFGPGDTVFRLTAANLKGHGVATLGIALDEHRAAALDAHVAPPLPVAWAHQENRWTRWTGAPPVFLPGMTPTTVESPMVAAAANGGFVAELAGGGQVTEALFRARAEELRAALLPGRGVVFNALYLDPYLWKLQVADGLLVRLRDEGAPLIGLTISAGVPPVDEAVELLRELHAHGLWLNAFKPGTDAQIKQVLAIADAAPDLTFAAHVEGGRAGGHHSWEDLADLVSRHYEQLRARKNLVLAVGGGIATPARAASWLDGSWATELGFAPMPVDAVFLGTVTMAALEAKTSPQVKAALAACPGVAGPVLEGGCEGGVRSGRSHLDADIHYLDNSASRCGELLDEVSRTPETLDARKDEIVAALARTAKPWFGELAGRDWAAVLRRYVELAAVGGRERQGSAWLDLTHRDRLAELVRTAEARLTDRQVDSCLQDPAELEVPEAFLDRFEARWPAARTACLHPEDVSRFLEVCRRPGKPVPFVPVIDRDVRRWFKSDALWQAHDDRYDADAVLVIPGPEAVAGIREVDEPVAELLARYTPATLRPSAPDPLVMLTSCREVALPGGGLARNPALRLFDPSLGAVRWERDPEGATCVVALDRDGKRTAEARRDPLGVVVFDGAGRALDLCLSLREGRPWWDREAFRAEQRAFWSVGAVEPPFATAVEREDLSRERIATFLLATLDDSGGLVETGEDALAPLSMTFPLAWKAILRVLAGVDPDLLDLVHEDHSTRAGPGWPLRERDVIEAVARVVSVAPASGGRRIVVEAELLRGDVLCAEVRTTFFVRGQATPSTDLREPLRVTIWLPDEAARDWLCSMPWFEAVGDLPLGRRLEVACALHTSRAGVYASVGIVRDRDRIVGRIALDPVSDVLDHPVTATCRVLAAPALECPLTPIRDFGALPLAAPADLVAYAAASGDDNPIHLVEAVARLAGHPGRIVHGMWTASAAAHRALQLAADGDGRRLAELSVRFLAVVLPRDELSVSVRQVAMREGHRLLEVDVTTTRAGVPTTVLTGTARLRPPRTAYVFPGQGMQAQGMGMAGYARSVGARRVWDEADAACRSALGFSILQVVRDNPGRLLVDDEILQHPNGVLHITRFTQVALVVLALAQIEELKEQQALVSDAWFCGHSLGEHSALGVFVRGLPLAGLVDAVYHRGKWMEGLVERDATGRSPFAMAAVRPHHAGLGEAGLRDLVARVGAETGLPLEIVNLNVRGRQYSVTGHVTALTRLRTELEALAATRLGGKEPFVDVAGVDMPFHSSILLPAVRLLRATLQRTWPETVDPEEVVGRYVPNLTASPFRLDRDYVEGLVALTGTTELDPVLADWDTWRASPGRLARTLLVELLAWQLAMPVRWIETQDVLIERTEEIVEIGLADQPILSGMLSQTLSLAPHRAGRPRVLHLESHRDELYGPVVSPGPEAAPATPTADAGPEPVLARAAPSGAAPDPVADVPVSVLEGVQVLLALQAKVRLEQLGRESLDEALGGNSARRNQVLADLAAEFGATPPDGAHELPLPELARQIEKLAPGWRAPGRYLGASVERALGRALGAAHLDRAAVVAHLEKGWGLGPGRATSVLLRVALAARDGASGRGGPLSVGPPKVADRAAGERWLDTVVEGWASEAGVVLGGRSRAPSATVAVDEGALKALKETLVGDDGLLTRAGRALSGHDPLASGLPSPRPDDAARRVAAFELDHGAEYEAAVAPRFDVRRHVAFTSAWAWGRRDLVESHDLAAVGHRLDEQGRLSARALGLELDPASQRWMGPEHVPTAPRNSLGDDGWRVEEVPRPDEPDLAATLARLDGLHPAVRGALERSCTRREGFGGRTALVTGASPGSIALEVVATLLERGARVIVTTTSTDPVRIATYKRLYQARAVPGAELHVVPFNQGSFADVDALLDWLGSGLDDVPCLPDLLVPFAAASEVGHLDPGGRSLHTLRVLLLGVERLIVATARASKARSVRNRRCHVLLPWSPNHGTLGGDGAYGESKAALETLVNRWRSERSAWGDRVSLVGARIGWVRGTGLMSANDVLAERLEADCGVRTFSTAEMGRLLVGLLGEETRLAAAGAPVHADLGGGLERVDDLSGHLARIRADLAASALRHRRRRDLESRLRAALHAPPRPVVRVDPRAAPTVGPPLPSDRDLAALPELDHLDPRHVVVVVGYGEVSPWGSARTRWAIERDGILSLEAAAELAWMTGCVRPKTDGTGWIDAASGQVVEDVELIARYGERLMNHAGIRVIEPEVLGFDPERLTSSLEVHLDHDFSFPVPTREVAEDLRRADPGHTVVLPGPGVGFTVVRRRGAVVRLPRALRSDRQVCGQIPSGWDPRRYGIASDLVLQVDRATLFGLVATAEAFLAAGLTPEEVLAHLHPTRVGSTQGNSMGGTGMLARMYRDLPDGRERQLDVLQEGLANVVVGYVVQSWLGSYGPMSFPAGACATSAVSVADAWEKILAGTADLLIAGATEDFNQEVSVSFADVGATASSDELLAKGIPAAAMSRPNDRRRGGFVEAHGAGVSVLCRASVAVEMGLPVYSIVAFAGSYGDGLYRSVPAPGLGPLGCMTERGPTPKGAVDLAGRRRQIAELHARRAELAAMFGAREADRLIDAGVRQCGHDFWRSEPTIAPLRGALAVFGLEADDIGLVSKHDTSTSANDPNENRMHQALQDKLGRTPGLPLPVVSQKALTGHPKGPAAAWQMNGVMQAMADGVIPGNHHLDDVDPEMAEMPSLLFTDRALRVGPGAPRAALITSLGFGHVGGIVALAHPWLFWRLLDPASREAYSRRLGPRLDRASANLRAVLSGRDPLFVARTKRPFAARDGTAAQTVEEIAKLTDASWRPA